MPVLDPRTLLGSWSGAGGYAAHMESAVEQPSTSWYLAEGKGKQKKKVRKNIQTGVAHISATFNNLLITITDMRGNTLAWGSAGKAGFKGSKKSTPFAATVLRRKLAEVQLLNQVKLHIVPPGKGCPWSGLEAGQKVVVTSTAVRSTGATWDAIEKCTSVAGTLSTVRMLPCRIRVCSINAGRSCA